MSARTRVVGNAVLAHRWDWQQRGARLLRRGGRDRVAPDDPDHPGDRRALALARCSGL